MRRFAAKRLSSTASTDSTQAFNSPESRLLQAGFSAKQATSITGAISNAVDTHIHTLQKSYIPIKERDQTIRAYMLDFSHLRSEIRLLEKNDFGILKQESERLGAESATLKTKIRDDLSKLQSGVRMEMEVDSARVKDEQHVMTGRVVKLEASLDEEIKGVRQSIDDVRRDTIKTIALTVGSVGLALFSWLEVFHK